MQRPTRRDEPSSGAGVWDVQIGDVKLLNDLRHLHAALPTTFDGSRSVPTVERTWFDSTRTADALLRWLPSHPGTWHVLPRLAFVSYKPGTAGHRHRDGVVWDAVTDCASTHSIILCVREPDKGGHTDFFGPATAEDLYRAEPQLSFAPIVGRMLVFPHHLYHQDSVVSDGIKGVLRADAILFPEQE